MSSSANNQSTSIPPETAQNQTQPTQKPSQICTEANTESKSQSVTAVAQPQQKTPFVPKYSFYRRNLPSPPAIAFASDTGKQLFKEALSERFMEGYFALAEQFRTQDEPAYCGISTLAMVLNTLTVDPKRIWKGPWRWYTEDMLDCCRPLEEVKEDGITFDQGVCLARCNGLKAIGKRPMRLVTYPSKSDPPIITEQKNSELEIFYTLDEFRADIKESCSTSGAPICVVSYSRKEFRQTGDGHFSPVGGYHPTKDLVYIMDVARYKYPPHWVPLPMLYDAMCRADPSTNQSRGWMMLTPAEEPKSMFFAWNASVASTQTSVPKAINEYNPKPSDIDFDIATIYYSTMGDTIEHICDIQSHPHSHSDTDHHSSVDEVIHCLYSHLPPKVSELLFTNYSERFHFKLSTAQTKIRNDILNGIRSVPIFKIMSKILNNNESNDTTDDSNDSKPIESLDKSDNIKVEMASLIFLVIPNNVWRNLPQSISAEIINVLKFNRNQYSALSDEIDALRLQLSFLRDLKFQTCSAMEARAASHDNCQSINGDQNSDKSDINARKCNPASDSCAQCDMNFNHP